MLSLNNFSTGYNNQLLEDISFSLKPGELVSIVGKSGCGKTTLLNRICEQAKGVQRTESIALVTQESLLLNWRTALQNVLLPKELAQDLTSTTINNAKQLLIDVRLQDAFYKHPKELSGGMKQRVSLARAFLQNADLYLFDEPLSAIDFDLRIYLGRFIRNFIVSNNKSAIFVTHNIEESISVGDRVIVLGGTPGKIICDEKISIEETKRDPISIRATKDFPRLFEVIWRAIEK